MKKYQEIITQEELNHVFEYNEETGDLIWKNPTKSYFKR